MRRIPPKDATRNCKTIVRIGVWHQGRCGEAHRGAAEVGGGRGLQPRSESLEKELLQCVVDGDRAARRRPVLGRDLPGKCARLS